MIKSAADDEDDPKMRKQSRWIDLVHTATEAVNTQYSLLQCLPPELRTKIWGYVLGHKHIYPNYPQPLRGNTSRLPRLICDCDNFRDELGHSRTKACFSAPLDLGILSVCRRTHLEALPVLWSTNTFCFEESYIIFLFFRSLASQQMSMVRNVRIDVNHFIRGGEWEINLRKSGLTTSLRSLRKLELVVNTFTTELFLATEPCGSIHPVNSVLEFPARRPSFAVVSVRRCNVYGTNDANELAENYGIEKCLERMQEILGEQQGAGKGG